MEYYARIIEVQPSIRVHGNAIHERDSRGGLDQVASSRRAQAEIDKAIAERRPYNCLIITRKAIPPEEKSDYTRDSFANTIELIRYAKSKGITEIIVTSGSIDKIRARILKKEGAELKECLGGGSGSGR